MEGTETVSTASAVVAQPAVSPESAPVTTETSTEAAAPATPEGTPTETPVTGVEAVPAGEQTAEVVPPEDDLIGEEIKPDSVSDGGKTLHFRASKAHKLLEAQAFQRGIQEQIPGATLDDIKQAYSHAVTLRSMADDFDSGDPQRVGQFVDFWLDPQKANPASVSVMADKMLNVLPNISPGIYDQVEKSVVGQFTDKLYRQAKDTGDEALFTLAQHLDHRLTGKYLQKEDFTVRNPEQDRLRELEEENRRLNEERQRARIETIRQRDAQLSADLSSVVNEEIEKALVPWAAFKDKPQWKYMVSELAEQVEAARKAAGSWSREFENDRRAMIDRPSEEAKQRLIARQRNLVKTVVARHRNDVTARHTGQILAQSAQTHQKLQAAQAVGSEPIGSASPTQPSGIVERARAMREQGKTAEEIFRAAVGA